MQPHVETTQLTIHAPGGRPLVEGLTLRIGNEHVALIGRNGAGKSSLLGVLAGTIDAHSGRVRVPRRLHFLPQVGERNRSASLGEQRRAELEAARRSEAEVLLLDEPSEHLDRDAVAWLRDWLRAWPGCVLMASHDRRLLAEFRHFFVLSESGCRYFGGTLADLEAELDQEQEQLERRYAANLTRLAAEESHARHVARRKARKKRYGRCRELDRGTPRIRLNQKRAQAQVSHGRLAKLREARLSELRQWTQSTRRALRVQLALELPRPALGDAPESAVVRLRGVGVTVAGRRLFAGLDLRLGRERVGIVGPNGAGKTTLLEVLLGRRAPDTGSAERALSQIGEVAQGGTNYALAESLLVHLHRLGLSLDECARVLLAHQFPLALGDRSLSSLSPGERARAALICLFARSPAAEVLVLDEPTYGLDLVGQRALTRALKAWPGGLVVATHDDDFLAEIGVHRVIELGA